MISIESLPISVHQLLDTIRYSTLAHYPNSALAQLISVPFSRFFLVGGTASLTLLYSAELGKWTALREGLVGGTFKKRSELGESE